MAAAVFAGPSLPEADRVNHSSIRYLSPASRGDLGRAAEAYQAVLLIDGVFHHRLAVSPKEAFEASQRALVFGASSMGALRAAECARYGMVPLGVIARWYRAGVIDGDDEVAVAVEPGTHRALSVPLVNVRYLARKAIGARILDGGEADALIRGAREMYYADRQWQHVLQLAPRPARAALQELCAGDGANLKRRDARAALRRLVAVLS